MPKKKITKRVKALFDDIKQDLPTPDTGHPVEQKKDEKEVSGEDIITPLREEILRQVETESSDASFVQTSDLSEKVTDSIQSSIQPDLKEESAPALPVQPVVQVGEAKSDLIQMIVNAKEKNWKDDDRMLVNEVADQLGLALENAQLFMKAQEELQERLRAQQEVIRRNKDLAAITKAVALLTEQGARSLPNVLQILGESTEVERLYFAQIREDESGAYWRATNDWCPNELQSKFDRKKLSRLLVSDLSHWATDLHEKGWVTGTLATSPKPENKYFSDHGVGSILWVAVPGRTTTPSYIAFETSNPDREFKEEEINAYRVVSDALSNTFTREGLLEQLQVSLDETENLYNASHRLAVASNLDEMLSAITQALPVPALTRAVLISFERDEKDEIQHLLTEAVWYNGRGTPPPAIGYDYPVSVYKDFYSRQEPGFFDDIHDIQIDSIMQTELKKQNIGSLAVLPLWTGKRQLGVVLLIFEDRHHFGSRELRTYPPLIDQMATSVDNLRLFRQTQAALTETGLLYRISSGVAEANNSQELIDLIISTVTAKETINAAIAIVIQDSTGTPVELEILSRGGKETDALAQDTILPFSTIQDLSKLTNAPLVVGNLEKAKGIAEDFKNSLLSSGAKSMIVAPLTSAGHLAGILLVTAEVANAFTSEGNKQLMLAAGGIAVAIERQRLLREAQRRALELQTAAEIARDTTSTLSIDQLLKRFVNQISDRFNLYHVAIYLVDSANQSAIIREGTGEAGTELKANGAKFEIGDNSLIGQAMKSADVMAVNDMSETKRYKVNPLLPDTKSQAVIPLKIAGRITGVLDVQSASTNAFTQNEISVLQILADQIAVAIENAQAFELSQKAVEELHEIDRIKNQFMANMSHELRTPLNSIIGFSRVILKGIDGPINDTQAQDLAAIYNSGQHLLNLINNILDLSKIEAGKMELQLSDINMIDVINAAMSTASGLIKDKPIKIEQKLPETLPMVRADQTRIRQVLINFISNSVKFTESGTITVEALASTSPNGRPEVMISVEDTGVGIDEKDRGKLFQPFSQVDDSPTRKAGGTGLGLSISRSIIEMHKGRIGLVFSEPGKGSKFFFSLPIPVEEHAVPRPEHVPQGNVVLAIDDNPDILSLYERYLKPQGYDVHLLSNPEEALDIAKKVHPFAILVDIMMPQKDGWSVIRDLKADPQTQSIPVVIASIVEEKERGLKLGVTDYLVKPFLQEDLVNAINRINQSGNIKKILLIDDDPDDIRLIQKIFEGITEYQLLTANGGREGLEEIHAQLPDAIILDLFMPDIDGFTLYEMIQSDENLAKTPVLFLTGADLSPMQSQLISEFGQKLLSKGIMKEEELMKTLKDAFERAQTSDKK